jgi:hypothetical protein
MVGRARLIGRMLPLGLIARNRSVVSESAQIGSVI